MKLDLLIFLSKFEIINSKFKFITAYTSAQIASLSTASGANGVR